MESQTPGRPDHAASPPGLLDRPEIRTLVQGVAIDVLAALALVVVQTAQSEDFDWRVLGLLLVKTLVYTLASSVMKYLRPVRREEDSSRLVV